MWLRLVFVILVGVLGLVSTARAYEEPARGSPLRAALMDALRPIAEWHYAPPVEFVVRDLRVSGDVAFASVTAQRPGGRQIDLTGTPGYRREVLSEEFDWTLVEALLKQSGKSWVPVHVAVSPSDAWWFDREFCPVWAPVLPQVCR